ncbi:nucleotide pyrophosphohydrolase [Nitrospira moscoviensis]|jgi:dCTP diphosphatase|uniref:MazG nucleotide pyrophosphohydrolase n=1 Tax=Nitrospira moscoviensis TaxID=42253 RepID=A0A0K2GFK4_NITMO|nr:nucleotide pyrophosphohydrolase [Nitrospira moscoviensis]ALA59731.1 MazG nucleotide pyrophosphohydrolase [Nitrospira moscoviensis]
MAEVEEVLRELRQFVHDRDWVQFHDPKNLAMALASEAGELLAELRWVRTEDADTYAKQLENRRRIQAEAADVGISLLLFCDRLGINLLDAMREKIRLNEDRYPVEKSKGRAERPL